MDLDGFLSAVTAWAAERPGVSALGLVGSHARGAATAGSDVDLVILCPRPAALLSNDAWIHQFGQVEASRRERYGVARCLRVFYRDGLEVEFGVADVSWARVPLDAGTKRVISDGMRILHDPDGLLRGAMDAAVA